MAGISGDGVFSHVFPRAINIDTSVRFYNESLRSLRVVTAPED